MTDVAPPAGTPVASLRHAARVALDSFEGVPEWPQPREGASERMARSAWQRALHAGFDRLGHVLPGLGLAAILAWLGERLAAWIGQSLLGFQHTPISAILVTVLLGLLVRNTAGLPAVYEQGLRLCVRQLLRVGIALLGLQLSVAAVGAIGLRALPIVAACILAALAAVSLLARLLGLPSRLAALIAVGTSICGVSAVVATGPVIDATEDEVSYAVACVTLFGVAALFCYPLAAHWLFGQQQVAAGLFLGTAIHDTSQVTAAALMYQQYYSAEQVLNVAATTKLLRNACMGLLIPGVALWARRQSTAGQSHTARRVPWQQWLPLFVVAFVLLATFRSLGDLGSAAFGLIPRDAWRHGLDVARSAALVCLTVSMAGVGLGTGLAQLRRLGWKPLCAGLAAALVTGAVSTAAIPWVLTHV